MPKIGITVFPGSNCERDIYQILRNKFSANVEYVWYQNKIKNLDAVIIPGGFTYGDRLRAGAIAAHSSLIENVRNLADKGIPILGICNGFQILVEAGILPGALTFNDSLLFNCSWVEVEVINNKTPFTNMFVAKQKISIPIAHGEGKYIIDKKNYKKLKKNDQITLKYSKVNPNGSLENIAAINNIKGNVMGMMPHPERGSDAELVPNYYNTNSILIFKSLMNYLKD